MHSDAGFSMGKSAGTGIKAGDQYSQQWTWRDKEGQILSRGVGATDPDWTIVGAGPFYDYAFALNDEVWINYHVPHDILPANHPDFQGIFFHVHWYQSGTNTASVKWQYTYTHALGFDQAAFSSTGTVITVEQTAPGIARQHMIAETTSVNITGMTEPDGIIKVHLKRITNGGTNNTDTIYVPTADIHYQSTNMGTVGKAPDFYE